jgi:NTP pyrophosphatase (non-canonical NTP hydrolase)
MNYATPAAAEGLAGLGVQAVICGSFRRDALTLRREFSELKEAGCAVLSPLDLDFVAEIDGFVYGPHDWGRSSAEVEQRHLRAMEKANLVWLHCPDGYVGTSAAMELGFARALGIRVFAAELPDDVTLSDLVQVCDSPKAAVASVKRDLGEAPSHALLALQSYYARAARQRGWSDETASLTLALLKGEIAELEEALKRAPDDEAAALELADVQLYVVHLANVLGITLGDAVRAKEKINTARFDRSSAGMAA